MRKFMPISSAVAALIITSVLSGCGGTSGEPVSGPTATSGAAQTTDSTAAIAEAAAAAEAVKAAEVAAVAEATKAAEAAKVAAAAKPVTAAKAKAAAAAKAKAAAAAKAKAAAAAKAKAAAAPATLRETCSKVEKALSDLSGKSSPPTAPMLKAALAQLKLINGAGDTETRNALRALLEALPRYRDEDPAQVANNGRRAFLDSLNNLADRCKAAGSPALQ